MTSHSSSVSPTLANTNTPSSSAVWVIVGASRGIGLEFVRQLLDRGQRVYAVIRDAASASQLWQLAGAGVGKCELIECDITDESSISVLLSCHCHLRDTYVLIQIRDSHRIS